MPETFHEDLVSGKQIEHEVCRELKKRYPSAYVVEGYCKEWDIVIPEIHKTVEVKQDEKSNFTGNFLIEVEFDGKLSALSTTKADIWVHVDKEFYYVMDTETLRWMLRELWRDNKGRKYTPASFIGKGDTRPKKAYLIPKSKFNNQFVRKFKRQSFSEVRSL